MQLEWSSWLRLGGRRRKDFKTKASQKLEFGTYRSSVMAAPGRVELKSDQRTRGSARGWSKKHLEETVSCLSLCLHAPRAAVCFYEGSHVVQLSCAWKPSLLYMSWRMWLRTDANMKWVTVGRNTLNLELFKGIIYKWCCGKVNHFWIWWGWLVQLSSTSKVKVYSSAFNGG